MDLDIIEDYTEILPNLYLGAHPKVDIMDTFKYIICMNGRPTYFIPVGRTVICHAINDIDILPDLDKIHWLADMTIDFMKKGPTLVHCAAGLNRSALVVGLALIKLGMTPENAVKHIQEKRSVWCLHNETFKNWLLTQNPADQRELWTPN